MEWREGAAGGGGGSVFSFLLAWAGRTKKNTLTLISFFLCSALDPNESHAHLFHISGEAALDRQATPCRTRSERERDREKLGGRTPMEIAGEVSRPKTTED